MKKIKFFFHVSNSTLLSDDDFVIRRINKILRKLIFLIKILKVYNYSNPDDNETYKF